MWAQWAVILWSQLRAMPQPCWSHWERSASVVNDNQVRAVLMEPDRYSSSSQQRAGIGSTALAYTCTRR